MIDREHNEWRARMELEVNKSIKTHMIKIGKIKFLHNGLSLNNYNMFEIGIDGKDLDGYLDKAIELINEYSRDD